MTKHVHAELMMQYAQDALETDKPWERWEYLKIHEKWERLTTNPAWDSKTEYRRINPYLALREITKDPTKQIRCTYKDANNDWVDCPTNFLVFGYPPEFYEVSDKPVPKTSKTKQVKLLGWLNKYGTLVHIEESHTWLTLDYKRVPSEDKIVEVEE